MKKFLLLTCLAATPSSAFAEDWPQWRGPKRDDNSQEKGLLSQWPDKGPQRVWLNKEGGLGYAGYSVVGDTLYTMGAFGNVENLVAINAKDGKAKWKTQIGALLTNKWGDGPRGTPTVDGEHVYTLSGQGNLVCVKAADGKEVWKAAMKDLGGKTPGWGYTESPLVDGDRVLCTPGGDKGAMAAFDKKTGKLLWQSKGFTEPAQYSSIIAADHNGKRQYIQLTQKKLAGVDAESGKALWTVDWTGKTAVIPTPIYHDGHVYVTSGYDAGCMLVKLTDDKPETVYKNDVMVNHHGGVVLVGDHLYGYSDKAGWTCQDFKTGKAVWSEKKALSKGCLTYADGKLYCLGESAGEVVLIDASPAGWKEHGRFKLEPQTTQRSDKGKVWTHPVIANGKLFLRDQELISCYDVGGKGVARAE